MIEIYREDKVCFNSKSETAEYIREQLKILSILFNNDLSIQIQSNDAGTLKQIKLIDFLNAQVVDFICNYAKSIRYDELPIIFDRYKVNYYEIKEFKKPSYDGIIQHIKAYLQDYSRRELNKPKLIELQEPEINYDNLRELLVRQINDNIHLELFDVGNIYFYHVISVDNNLVFPKEYKAKALEYLNAEDARRRAINPNSIYKIDPDTVKIYASKLWLIDYLRGIDLKSEYSSSV